MPARTTSTSHALIPTSSRRPPTAMRRPAMYLAVAAAGALVVNVLWAQPPAASAAPEMKSVSIAKELGVSASPSTSVRPLEQLVADRSQRLGAQTAAARVQAAAAAAAKAAAAKAAAAAAASRRTSAPAPSVPASSGSYQSYAMAKVGSGQFGCLESLWGRESGWNPNAQNPGSTAYGIPQFLDSTWASTGIAKTSNGYRQIDAGLSYVDSRYGSPCGAWAHSQATGWY